MASGREFRSAQVSRLRLRNRQGGGDQQPGQLHGPHLV